MTTTDQSKTITREELHADPGAAARYASDVGPVAVTNNGKIVCVLTVPRHVEPDWEERAVTAEKTLANIRAFEETTGTAWFPNHEAVAK